MVFGNFEIHPIKILLRYGINEKLTEYRIFRGKLIGLF